MCYHITSYSIINKIQIIPFKTLIANLIKFVELSSVSLCGCINAAIAFYLNGNFYCLTHATEKFIKRRKKIGGVQTSYGHVCYFRLFIFVRRIFGIRAGKHSARKNLEYINRGDMQALCGAFNYLESRWRLDLVSILI